MKLDDLRSIPEVEWREVRIAEIIDKKDLRLISKKIGLELEYIFWDKFEEQFLKFFIKGNGQVIRLEVADSWFRR